MRKAIIVMAKAPLAGMVKTRLQPILSGEKCAALAECFLRDTIAKIEPLDEQLIIAYAPSNQRGFFEKSINHKTILFEQTGGNLGERIHGAFQHAFEKKFSPAVMIGTDSPTFPAAFIKQAFEFLETGADSVLGGTTDGGFYLIGLRHLKKEIFENVEWSSEKTFDQTARNIKKAGLKLRKIPVWYDVDEPPDLIKLKEELAKNSEIAPQTFSFLNEPDLPIQTKTTR